MDKEEKKHYVWFDWAMKHMLRNKANFEVLEGFIQAITGKKMTVLEVLESEGNQEEASSKFNRVDIKAKNSDEEIVIIEVQNIREMDFLERILFGVASAITEQVHLGEPYSKIHKVYSISVVYFDFGKGGDYVYHGQTRLRGLHIDDELIINSKEKKAIEGKSADHVFPEYFIVRVEKFNPDNIAPNYQEQWMDYLKTGRIRREYDAPGLQKAREVLMYDQMTEAQKKQYRNHLDEVRIQQNAIDDSREEGRAEGLEEGRAKGLEEGRSEGIEIGLERGRTEANYATARNLLQMGLSPSLIAQATGLTEDEIAGLSLVQNR